MSVCLQGATAAPAAHSSRVEACKASSGPSGRTWAEGILCTTVCVCTSTVVRDTFSCGKDVLRLSTPYSLPNSLFLSLSLSPSCVCAHIHTCAHVLIGGMILVYSIRNRLPDPAEPSPEGIHTGTNCSASRRRTCPYCRRDRRSRRRGNEHECLTGWGCRKRPVLSRA
jgi:hypothetical protein